MQAYTYILRCSGGYYYTGSTKDLKRRMQEHLSIELVYYEVFDRIDEAFKREH